MTVYIDKEEKGHRMVRPGPVVFASGSILGLNEFGEMKNIEDNKYFTDSTEEGTFTVTKHGLNIPVIAHPSFIWTANPVGGRWKNPEIITEFDFPILAQWGDRMDFIIPFIEKTDEASIREYAKQRLELEKKLGSIGSTTLWLKKYLYHARSLNPYLPDSVRKILENYLVEIAKRGVRGVARKLEALERAAIGFAKLKLKDVVDEDDAYDTITLFNDMFRFYKQEVILPGHMVFLHGLNILQKSKPQKWSIDQLIEKVCSENKGDDLYIGKVKKSQYNYKIKALKPLFNKHPNVQICSRNPTVYAWIDNDSPNESGKNTNSRNNLSDITDVTDVTDEQKGNNKSKIKQDNSVDNSTSHVDEVSPASPITVNIRTSETFSSDASVTSEDSSGITGNKMNLEEPQLVLRHSSAAHILTNNDLEEVKDSTDETGSQSF